MSRLQHVLTRLSPRDRIALAAVLSLVLVVAAATLVPRGGDSEDGAVRPATDQSGPTYVARDGAPAPGRVSVTDRAEIERVLADGPPTLSLRRPAAELARDLARCATFEGQQYCLGVGWTDADAQDVQAEAAAPTLQNGRAVSVETTGDLSTADLLAQRAALPADERLADERAELEAAAASVSKVVLLRHQLLGEPLPTGFLDRHPEARAPATSATAGTSAREAADKGIKDYPRRSTVLHWKHVRAQRTTYWCGPTTMQAIAWGWQDKRRTQQHWADRLGTTTSGSSITEMVRVVNDATGYDQESYAGKYIVLDISDWSFRQWTLLQMRHIEDYRAPVVLHPILLKRFYPYLDDDASGHFQVGRGYDKAGDKPTRLGYFEPWNQQRFDPSEPYISRVQWRNAYQSYRANLAHPHRNIGV
jgi:hypothetical protein